MDVTTLTLYTKDANGLTPFPVVISAPVGDGDNTFVSIVTLGDRTFNIYGVDVLQTLLNSLTVLKAHVTTELVPNLFWADGTAFSWATYSPFFKT